MANVAVLIAPDRRRGVSLSTGSLASISQAYRWRDRLGPGTPPASHPTPRSPTTRLLGPQVDEEALGHPAEVRCRLRGGLLFGATQPWSQSHRD